MNKICKLTVATLMFTIIFTTTNLKAQDEEDSGIGLTLGLDYISNYLYRGQYRYRGKDQNGGLFSPYIIYNVFNTGFSLGIRGEIGEIWVWAEKDESTDNYIDKYSATGFNANYMHSFNDKVTLNLGAWYYRYKIFYDKTSAGQFSLDPSYLDICFSAVIEMLPLKPMFAVTYSYYMDEKYYRGYDKDSEIFGEGPYKNGNLYIRLGVGHSFRLAAAYLDLDAVVGFYDKNAYDTMIYEPRSPDISDIDLSAGVSTTAGILALSMSFHYVIVPGTQYKKASFGGGNNRDIHKFYAKFGVACSI